MNMDLTKVNRLGWLATALYLGGSAACWKGYQQGSYAVVAGAVASVAAMHSASKSKMRPTDTVWTVIGTLVTATGVALSQTRYAQYDLPVISAGAGLVLLTWSRSMTL